MSWFDAIVEYLLPIVSEISSEKERKDKELGRGKDLSCSNEILPEAIINREPVTYEITPEAKKEMEEIADREREKEKRKYISWHRFSLTDEEFDDYFLEKVSYDVTYRLIKERETLDQIKRVEFGIEQRKQNSKYLQRLKTEKEIYLTDQEKSISLNHTELRLLIEKMKNELCARYSPVFDKICSSTLIIDTCIFEGASDKNYKGVLDALLEYCEQKHFKLTLLPHVYHEIINHSNGDNEDTKFRGRTAKKEVERFLKKNCIIFPEKNQIRRSGKIVNAYADDQICDVIEEKKKSGIPCSLLTEDRDLQLRFLGIVQDLPEDIKQKFHCLSIEDILK